MKLTPRERAVAQLIIESKTDRQIAEVLEISTHTVRGYVKQVFKKLQIHKRTGVQSAIREIGAPCTNS